MSAADLVHELQAAGAVIEARGDRLRVEAPPGVLTPERREALRASKAEILAAITEREGANISRADQRAIVQFVISDAPDSRPVAVGAPGESIKDITATLRRRYGRRLLDVQPWQGRTEKRHERA